MLSVSENLKSFSYPSRKQLNALNDRICSSLLLDPDNLLNELSSLQPEGCTGAELFKWDYLRKSLLSKLPREGVPASVRRERAIDKMLAQNEHCRIVNEQGFSSTDPRFQGVLLIAKRIIAKVMGPLCITTIMEGHAFSSGATTSKKRTEGDIYYKYRRTRLDTTARNYKYALSVIRATPLWKSEEHPQLRLVVGNSVFTVPKETDEDRAAAKESDMNVGAQRSVGSHIRKRFKRICNVNLNDQTTNQDLSRIGSKYNHLSTLDCKGASNSVSQRLVFELFSTEWVEFLDDIRSPYGMLPDGRTVRWEMHSSMGNGYTFELESLIFWSLSEACRIMTLETLTGPHQVLPYADTVNVFGDDIICPRYSSPLTIEVLQSVGFTINLDKSFIDGPFRESCGAHWYNGIDVSPFYIRKPIDSVTRVIWLLNSIRIWSLSRDIGICDPTTATLWRRIRREFLPPCLLGGKELRSVTSVFSPEARRLSLILVQEKKKIDGAPAVLRAFQYNASPINLSHVKWYEPSAVDYSEGTSLSFIDVRDGTPSYKFILNDGYIVDHGLYPDEL